MDISEMRKKFNDTISAMVKDRRQDNKAYLNNDEYSVLLSEVKNAKSVLSTRGTKKSVKDYRRVKKYDILICNGKERLIKPSTGSASVQYYVTTEELFDIIHSTHTSIGHGGRNRMVNELKTRYCNITIDSIMRYLQLCEQCQNRSSNQKKSAHKSLNLTFNTLARVDFIDMQINNYLDYQYIMIYQDQLTKLVLLKSLKSKCAKEVARNLLDIFTTFGAPVLLWSNDGREFVDLILIEIQRMWSEVKIICGKLSNDQENHKDIEEMLASWMLENDSQDWTMGLKFVQLRKNRAFHSGIGRSPFQALFGCRARIGLATAGTSSLNTGDRGLGRVVEPIQDDDGNEEIASAEDVEESFEDMATDESNRGHIPSMREEESESANLYQRKWKSLRDSYSRERAKQKKETGSAAAKFRKKYKYFDQLRFLETGMKPTEENNTLSDEEQITIEDIKIEQDAMDPNSELDNFQDQRGTQQKRKRNEGQDEDFLETLRAKYCRQDDENRVDDDDKLFLLSLHNDLKTLPDYIKLSVKSQIVGILSIAKQAVYPPKTLFQEFPSNSLQYQSPRYKENDTQQVQDSANPSVLSPADEISNSSNISNELFS